MAAGFNEIMALAQADFDAEVLSKVNGLTVRLINQGVQSDMNSNSYLAGSGSNLSLVGITDDSADSQSDHEGQRQPRHNLHQWQQPHPRIRIVQRLDHLGYRHLPPCHRHLLDCGR